MIIEKNKAVKVLFDLIEDEVLNLTCKELEGIYKVDDLSESEEILQAQSMINDVLINHSKSTLQKARADLDCIRLQEVKKQLKLDNPMQVFIDAIHKGLIPKELTMAFRDGKDISDEEMTTILQDLIDLGINIFDE